MNNLPNYAKALLLQGASTTGNFTEGYYYAEERLQVRHSADLLNFCQWIDCKIGGASAYNIDMLYAAYKNPQDEKLASYAVAVATAIRAIRSGSNC